jgi:hypothetical protein
MTPFNLQPNDKYGLIIIPKVYIADTLPEEIQLAPDLWIYRKTNFNLSENWKKWIGSLSTDRLEKADLFLVSKGPSTAPKVLDGDNERYKKRIFDFYIGLLISASALYHDSPFILTGAHIGDEVDVRQVGDYKTPQYIPGSPYDKIDLNHLNTAASIAEALKQIQGTGKHHRLIRVIRTFYEGIVEDRAGKALHQFIRCIEGLILPEIGNTKRRFLSRTELFIGPRHHELMGILYDIRSAVEHMHDPFYYLSIKDEKEREATIFKSSLEAKSIAQYCIKRILTRESLRKHFENEVTIRSFWDLDNAEKRKLWGDTLDIDTISKSFDRASMQYL